MDALVATRRAIRRSRGGRRESVVRGQDRLGVGRGEMNRPGVAGGSSALGSPHLDRDAAHGPRGLRRDDSGDDEIRRRAITPVACSGPRF